MTKDTFHVSPDELKAWMNRNLVTKSSLHRSTGVARTTINRYLDGSHKITRVFALACMSLDMAVRLSDNQLDYDSPFWCWEEDQPLTGADKNELKSL